MFILYIIPYSVKKSSTILCDDGTTILCADGTTILCADCTTILCVKALLYSRLGK